MLLTASLGDAFVRTITPAIGLSWPARAVAALTIWLALRALPLGSPAVVRRISARVARWRRWEFWRMWLFYAPVAVWVAWLALRFRGLATMTAANPGIPDGGTVGESKADILRKLPRDVTIASAAIAPGTPERRSQRLLVIMAKEAWQFPLVLKPDIGQRGSGVKLIRTEAEALAYLTAVTGAVLAQPYHSGPFEAGVFYYRMPGWTRGRIFSITDKHFPVVTGDGRRRSRI